MGLDKNQIEQWAHLLDVATLESTEVDRITALSPLSIQDAYLIQDAGIKLRLKRGERVVGMKMGLTSKAKMGQMGVEDPIYGVLTDAMLFKDESEFSMVGRIHPKIEPEIAFITSKELKGSVSLDQALSACQGVCVAMEIIDSRFRDFKFELPDVIADNCSSSGLVLGRTLKKPHEVDLGNLGMIMEVNGKSVQFGASSAILGHPGASIVELVKMLAAHGQSLPAGSIVLAGSATAAIALEVGTEVKTTVQDLGSVTLQIGMDS